MGEIPSYPFQSQGLACGAMGTLRRMWPVVQPVAQYHHPRDRAGMASLHHTTKSARYHWAGGPGGMSEVLFHFDDKLYKGHRGEPMAAALLRSGLLSITSSTYHGRP